MGSQKLGSKNQNLLWSDYLSNTHEPKTKSEYDLSPELEEDLLEHGVFLKQRVWRNMKRIRRQNSRLVQRQRHNASRHYRVAHIGHTRRLAHP